MPYISTTTGLEQFGYGWKKIFNATRGKLSDKFLFTDTSGVYYFRRTAKAHGNCHSGGFNACFLDGHTEFMTAKIAAALSAEDYNGTVTRKYIRWDTN